MEIKDVIHGTIELKKSELPILDSPYFQRLRMIKQLGFSEHSYPSANHNRYIHSLGAMETVTRVFRSIFPSEQYPQLSRFLSLTRLSALLHDIGHGPLSHTTEFAMPSVSKLRLDSLLPVKNSEPDRQATHEDYTLKIILDSGLTPLLEKAGEAEGFTPKHVAALIDPRIAESLLENGSDDFFQETIDGQRVSFLPILQQLISSEIDADRMDYLRRDSFYAGVSYGHFDADWLTSNLTFHISDQKCYLALRHRALYTFEDFLISRYHMFLMVYFHYKGVIYDAMLAEYFNSPECDYDLPSDIEKYCECNDAHLHSHLSKSSNPWAKRITERKPYRLLFELHSGIPSAEWAWKEQQALLEEIKVELKSRDIHFLSSRSTGEISKYFKKRGSPIFVRYDNHLTSPLYIPLEDCTDLFTRYKEKRMISRLYVSAENYRKLKNDSAQVLKSKLESHLHSELGLTN